MRLIYSRTGNIFPASLIEDKAGVCSHVRASFA